MLSDLDVIGFVPVVDLETALRFYRDVLGLELVENDERALVFDAHGRMIRVVAAGEFVPQRFTILGWEAPRLRETVGRLSRRGVEFIRYGHFEQDDLGIWTAPNGDQVAWFHDPDGNVLSLSAHIRPRPATGT